MSDNSGRLSRKFFSRDVLDVAPDLLGRVLVRRGRGGKETRDIITEVEAYRGERDLACHASKGRTKRTEIMYEEAGLIYTYLIYGKYWLLNIVTGEKGVPQAVLIRATKKADGPGKVSDMFDINESFYGVDITKPSKIWIERSDIILPNYKQYPRVGVQYAGDWAKKPWRFIMED